MCALCLTVQVDVLVAQILHPVLFHRIRYGHYLLRGADIPSTAGHLRGRGGEGRGGEGREGRGGEGGEGGEGSEIEGVAASPSAVKGVSVLLF